jgi:molecular chaperone DnaK (HSP70)
MLEANNVKHPSKEIVKAATSEAERVKRELSQQHVATAQVDGLEPVTLTRAKFEALIDDLP